MSKNKALVVDDVAMNRSFIKSYLATRGFDVETAEDGLQALEKTNSGSFDLIFSDIEMPNMNGLEFLRSVKQQSAYKSVPFVLLTTVDSEEVIKRAEKLGAVYYMVKPFNNEKMEEALKISGF